jgi:FKBP-type peptidyl-prolyl cis-trans isomerase 2
MRQAKENDKVKVHYTGKLKNGQVFDTSKEREPLEFQIGEQTIIPGFENAVKGMQVNEKKEVTILPEDAYGEVNENMIHDIPRENIEQDVNPEVGQEVAIKLSDGSSVPAQVIEVNEKSIKIDANHPLAGRELQFELELVEIL